MYRLPSRWGAFRGIENLPMIIAVSHVVVYVFNLLNPGLTASLVLFTPAVDIGEYWRLVTFLFVPPALNPLFMVFWVYLIYTYAQALEQEWGTFRFTVYYLVGALATGLLGLLPIPGVVLNVYLNASLFLAFAALFPDFQLMLFFILPVKVKYLGYLTWAWMIYSLLVGSLLTRLTILAALANYFLLLGPDIWENMQLRWQVFQNRRRWKVK